MHRSLSHERANLVEDNEEDDDDEEETVIELHRGITGSFSSAKPHGEAARNLNGVSSSSSSSSPLPQRRMSSLNSKIRLTPAFEIQQHHHGSFENENQSHAIRVSQQETRPASSSSATAPLMGKFQSVLTATTQVVNHLDTVADSVAEAMSLLQHPFGGGSHQHQQAAGQRKASGREAYSIEPKLQEARDAHTKLKLQAFWQLLLTGFEVLKFAIGKRARKRILWLALDGKLCLTHAKNDRKLTKSIFLADIYTVQKGSEAQSFTKSQSWRDARGSGREQLCFSLHGNCGSGQRRRQESLTTSGASGNGTRNGEKTFALQVRVASVRNVLVENFDALLNKMKSDADGEFPFVAQRVIAQQFAATGAVLSLYQVEDILLREEDEKKSGGGGSLKDHASSSPDKTKSRKGLSVIDGDSGDDDSDGDDDQRDILG